MEGSGGAPRARGDRPHAPRAAVAEDGFDALRALLVGPEQRELLELQSHVLDPAVQTHDVARVLPDAIALRADDPRLSHSLAPLIERGITASVRRDPRPLADALFPVIGPAIRRAIGHTLAAMMDTFSRSIEHSVSWRALGWRWTAWKTGQPFGEIVLLNTLQYRVEQVFLIHAETGLLLQHVGREAAEGHDGDQVSAMLTAIQDFVRDSFSVAGDETLDALRVGELSVLVERGPHAVLAAVVRGNAPPAVRALLQDALEAVHRQLGPDLRSFQGDALPFARARPILETCLVTEFSEARKARSPRWLLAAALILLVAGGVWLWTTARDRQRWNAYVDRLRAEPGIVVLSSAPEGGRFVLAGLRDPLATDPRSLMPASGIDPARVETRWEPYQALQPRFVTARAATLLRPPPGVTLAFRDGVLTATGEAPARWIADSQRLAPALAGVQRLEYRGADPLLALEQRLEARPVLFSRGTADFAPGEDATIRTIAALLRELDDAARASGARARVEIRGHTDTDGSEGVNDALSHARARAVAEAVAAARFDALEFSTSGAGSAEPIATGAGEQDKQRNRRASIRVTLAEAAPSRVDPRP